MNKEKTDENVASGAKKEVVVEEPNITPVGNRKVKFADESGKELEQIRYFEVEEGERC